MAAPPTALPTLHAPGSAPSWMPSTASSWRRPRRGRPAWTPRRGRCGSKSTGWMHACRSSATSWVPQRCWQGQGAAPEPLFAPATASRPVATSSCCQVENAPGCHGHSRHRQLVQALLAGSPWSSPPPHPTLACYPAPRCACRSLTEEVERLRAATTALGREKAGRDVELGEALTKVPPLRLAGQLGRAMAGREGHAGGRRLWAWACWQLAPSAAPPTRVHASAAAHWLAVPCTPCPACCRWLRWRTRWRVSGDWPLSKGSASRTWRCVGGCAGRCNG